MTGKNSRKTPEKTEMIGVLVLKILFQRDQRVKVKN
jgi:hypothetical protein